MFGIDSLKIEGRKKSYEYVSIVTKIYRKYIDLAKDKTKEYKVEDEDLKEILQIYNRGGMGTGYFKSRENIVYPEKPNHLGVFVGNIKKINSNKKQVTLDLKEEIKLGDVISINDETSYISEIQNSNIVGEIKSLKNVKIGDKVYRIVSNSLNKKQWEIYKKENRKIDISSKFYEDDENIYLELFNEKIKTKTVLQKENWIVNALEYSRIIAQIQKTGNTIFNIKNLEIDVQNLKIPISILNNLRRTAIEDFENELEKSIRRNYDKEINIEIGGEITQKISKPKINLYIIKFDKNIDYSKLDYNEIYIQFKDLIDCKNLRDCIVVLPTIIDEKYEKFIENNKHVFDKVKAIQITHISQIEFLKKLGINKKIVGDYTLNISNNLSENLIKDLGVTRFTISPELDINQINSFSEDIEKELVVYGRICLMTSKYCPIGKNTNCGQLCKTGNFELNDRINYKFPILADSINCHTKIYNSKILSKKYQNYNIDYIRLDIFDEIEQEIKQIIKKIKQQS